MRPSTGLAKSLPKFVEATLAGVRMVSLVLAPVRRLSLCCVSILTCATSGTVVEKKKEKKKRNSRAARGALKKKSVLEIRETNPRTSWEIAGIGSALVNR